MTRRLLCGALVVALTAGGCSSAPGWSVSFAGPAERREVVLPTVLCGDLFVASVRVEGEGPFAMLVDTGAPATQLSRRLVRRLGLGGSVGRIDVGELAIRGRIPFVAGDFEARSLALGTPLDGTLGYTLFGDLLQTYDAAAGRVRVARGRLTADAPGTVAMSRGERPFVRARVGGRELALLVDTGFTGGLSLRPLDGLRFLAGPRVVGSRVRSDGAHLVRGGRLADDLEAGAFEVRRPIVSEAVGRNLLGQAVLRHFVVTLDPRRGLARFEPSGGGPPPALVEMPSDRGTGMVLVPGDDAFRVHDVVAGSSAERAGILPGDRVVAVDGVAITADRGCSPATPAEAPAEPATLTVERGGRRFEVTVERGVLIP